MIYRDAHGRLIEIIKHLFINDEQYMNKIIKINNFDNDNDNDNDKKEENIYFESLEYIKNFLIENNIKNIKN